MDEMGYPIFNQKPYEWWILEIMTRTPRNFAKKWTTRSRSARIDWWFEVRRPPANCGKLDSDLNNGSTKNCLEYTFNLPLKDFDLFSHVGLPIDVTKRMDGVGMHQKISLQPSPSTWWCKFQTLDSKKLGVWVWSSWVGIETTSLQNPQKKMILAIR